MKRLPEPVYQFLPTTEAAQQLAAGAVFDHWQQQQPEHFPRLHQGLDHYPPLVAAALTVPDDLCLMELRLSLIHI